MKNNTLDRPHQVRNLVVESLDSGAKELRSIIDSAYESGDTETMEVSAQYLGGLAKARALIFQAFGIDEKPGSALSAGGTASDTPVKRRLSIRRRTTPVPQTNTGEHVPSPSKKVRRSPEAKKRRLANKKLVKERTKSGLYTQASAYRPWILLALHNAGGWVWFHSAQEKMFAQMDQMGMLKELDKVATKGTTRPRYLAQTSALRATLLRNGVIATKPGPEGQALDHITPAGIAELKASEAGKYMDSGSDGATEKKARPRRSRAKKTPELAGAA